MGPDSDTESADGRTRGNMVFLAVVLAITVIAYAPMLAGVWELSTRTTQAVNAFVLLGVAFVDAGLTVTRRQAFRPALNPTGLLLLAISCVVLTVATFTSAWPLAVLGLCLNLAALLAFFFGRPGVVAFYPALAGFGALVLMLMTVPQCDAWLRLLAGTVAAKVLPVLGIRADLVVQADPFQVILLAEKGAGVFNVAAECNGFGILMSSGVLALILALRQRLHWIVVTGLVGIALGVGIVFNVVRIVAIMVFSLQTNLAYGLIHEGLGSLIYLLALGAVCAMALMAGRRRA